MGRRNLTPKYFLAWGAIALVGVAADGVLGTVLRSDNGISTLREGVGWFAGLFAIAFLVVSIAISRRSTVSGLALFVAGLGLTVEESLLLLLLETWTPGWWLAHLVGIAGVLLVWGAFIAHEQDREAAEATLQDVYERKRRTLVNSAAHELSTPLTSVKIQLHLLKRARESGQPAETDRALDVIERNVDRLDEVGRDLLAAIRAEDDADRTEAANGTPLPLLDPERVKPS